MNSTTKPTTRHYKASSVWHATQKVRAFAHHDLSFMSPEHKKAFDDSLAIGKILEGYFIRESIPYKETKSSLNMSTLQAMKYLKKVYYSKLTIH